jgi:hypothetical protein
MTCNYCGRRCKGAICRDCELDELYEEPEDEPDVLSDGGQHIVQACPECDSCNLNERQNYVPGSFEQYHCNECGADFAEPVERPEKTPGSGNLSAAGKALYDADPDMLTDGGHNEEITPDTRAWVEEILARLEMVAWDRYVTGVDPNLGTYLNVYGWIDRKGDDYKDFVLVRFFPETEDNVVGFTTSSDQYSEAIHRLIYDADPDDHNPCRRVEHAFDVPNAIELDTEDGELIADGGRQAGIGGPARSDPPTKDSVKAAFGVVGTPRDVLRKEFETLGEIEDASRVQLVRLDGVGHATVDKIEDADALYEEGDGGYLVPDGGSPRRNPNRGRDEQPRPDSVRQEAGVAQQCRNGTAGCPGPDSGGMPCPKCFFESSDSDDRELRADGGTQGAIDHDFEDAEKTAREQLEAALEDAPGMAHNLLGPGDVAIDLVTRQPLLIIGRSADSLVEFYEDTVFDLSTYKQHAFLPVRLDDPVFECVFIGGIEDLHSFSNTYDYPAGRLARVPHELATAGESDE